MKPADQFPHSSNKSSSLVAKLKSMGYRSCADPESFVRGGPTLFFCNFLVDERVEDPSTTKRGPSSSRQHNAIYMALSWRVDGGPTLMVAW